MISRQSCDFRMILEQACETASCVVWPNPRCNSACCLKSQMQQYLLSEKDLTLEKSETSMEMAILEPQTSGRRWHTLHKSTEARPDNIWMLWETGMLYTAVLILYIISVVGWDIYTGAQVRWRHKTRNQTKLKSKTQKVWNTKLTKQSRIWWPGYSGGHKEGYHLKVFCWW